MKYLFARGYKKINGAIIILKIIDGMFKLIKTKIPIDKSIVRVKNAFNRDNCEEARGLVFVLFTFLSIFISKISFTIHPADLIIIDPTKNRIRYLNI